MLSNINKSALKTDLTAFPVMIMIAGCGIMYEYLISHYAAKVLGSTEIVIYTIISIMLAAMGIGSWAAGFFKKNLYDRFAQLESLIALVGTLGVVLIAVSYGLAYALPKLLTEAYGINNGMSINGPFVTSLQSIIRWTPYIMAAILGVLIGAEIPIMANIREMEHEKKLHHNMGTMYGVDYVGAAIGAILWITVLIMLPVSVSTAIIASINIFAGIIFVLAFKRRLKRFKSIVAMHLVAIASVLFIYDMGDDIELWSESLLYKDEIIMTKDTRVQHTVVTSRPKTKLEDETLFFFINGHTQFSSADEKIYHSFLVTPSFLSTPEAKNILVIGGGDGMAVRNLLKFNPDRITLVDLDDEILKFFKEPYYNNKGKMINDKLLKLNEYAFNDPRVQLLVGDANLKVDELILQGQNFDIVIVDLPDPNHPDLNRLYSTTFYRKLNHMLVDNGTMAIQSTSPYHARNAFVSIKKTVEASGFMNVEQYHTNVPSFGEWGWTIATKNGVGSRERILKYNDKYPDDGHTTKMMVLGSFEFAPDYYNGYDEIKINHGSSFNLYNYNKEAWKQENLIYPALSSNDTAPD